MGMIGGGRVVNLITGGTGAFGNAVLDGQQQAECLGLAGRSEIAGWFASGLPGFSRVVIANEVKQSVF